MDQFHKAGTFDEFMASNSLAVVEKTLRVECPTQGWIVFTEDEKVYFIGLETVRERYGILWHEAFERELLDRRERIKREAGQ